MVTRHATDLACASCPAPSAAPTNDCAAMASESSTSARKFHNCSTTWWAATAAAPNRAATAPAETKQAWNAIVRSTRSRPMTTWARSTAGWIRSGTRSTSRARRNSSAASHCPTRFATAEPTSSSRGMPSQPYTSSGHSTADTAKPATT